MFPYYLFLAIVMILAWIAFKKRTLNKLGFWMLFAVMMLFAGLRSAEVGTDTNNYANVFEDRRYELWEMGEGIHIISDEPGYYYLQKILGDITDEYLVLLMGTAAIFCFFVLNSLRQTSVMPIISLFVFITLGYYTFVFNAARQGLALSIYMAAIPYITKRRFWAYTLIVFCAAMFHKTIVVAIPLYFFFTMKYSVKSLILVLGGGLVIGFMLPLFLAFGGSLEDRYTLYMQGSATGGYLLTVFYVILAVFFIMQRKHIKAGALECYDVYLHMLLVGCVIYLIVSLTGSYVELTRFAAYFQIGSVFLWAILSRERKTALAPGFYVVAIVGHLAFFAIFLTKMANLTPYLLNPIFID